MAEAKAILRNYRQSPRKVRLVADTLRGKKVNDAFVTLQFLNKRASSPLNDLLKSAKANAKNLNMNEENLFVKEISVNEGPIMYRRRARARGSAAPIRKRTSHVSLVLEEKPMKTIDKKHVTDDKKSKSKVKGKR